MSRWPIKSTLVDKNGDPFGLKQTDGAIHTFVERELNEYLLNMILVELRKINFQLSTFTEITLDDGEF